MTHAANEFPADNPEPPVFSPLTEKEHPHLHPPAPSRLPFSTVVSLLISAIVHLLVLIIIAVLILPAPFSTEPPLTVELKFEVEDPHALPMEILALAASIDAPEPVEQASSQPVTVDPAEVEIPVPELTPEPQDAAATTTSATTTGPKVDQRQQVPLPTGNRAEDHAKPGAQFFGTVAFGDRFVYILDRSGSMDNDDADKSTGTRFKRATEELLRSVAQLREDQQFYVVLFAEETMPMLGQSRSFPKLVRATAENKERLRAWLQKIKPSGNTDPREALHLGLGLNPSAVFLLSDGEFKPKPRKSFLGLLGSSNPKVEEVVNKHRQAQIPIHTFAYEDPISRVKMKSLAAITGGEYEFVPHVKGSSSEKEKAPTIRGGGGVLREKTLLSMARSLESAGRIEPAERRYERIIAEFPGTPEAREARQRLTKIRRSRLPSGP